MFAAHYKLDNFVVIVDNNGLQIDGKVSEVAGLEPLDKKFESFGFEVIKICGHCFNQIEEAFEKAKSVKGKPTVIIAETVKGKGVSYMEDQVGWHGKAPNQEQYELALNELKEQQKVLEAQLAEIKD